MTNIYGKLSAQDALALFAKRRQDMQAKVAAGIPLTAEEKYEQDGGMTDLAQQNPDAWQLLKTGTAPTKDPATGKNVRDVFNPETGEWTQQDVHGYWSHPESWLQLAAGAGMGVGVGLAASGINAASGAAAAQGGLYGSEFVAPTVASNAAAYGGAAAAAGGGGTLASLATNPDVVRAVIGTGGSVVGGIIQTKAQQAAADAQAAAAKYAADLQDAAAKRTEQFLREQAENQFANSEASRKGNYDQWRSRENRFSTLSQTLGAGARDIPDYVPGVDPRYTTTSQQTYTGDKLPGGTSTDGGGPTSTTQVQPGGASLPMNPGGNPGVASPANQGQAQTNSDPTMQALLDNYKALGRTATGPGTGPTDIAYFAKRIAETGGLTDANKNYWFGPNGRIAKELAGSVAPEGSGQQSTTQSQGPSYQGFQYTPTMTSPLTPALSSAPTPQLQMPGSLAQLAQQQKWFY